MDDLKNISTAPIQKNQRDFDSMYFDKKYSQNGQDFEKLRHVVLHLIKTVGEVAGYCEMKEHGKQPDQTVLTDELLPDLYLHALQIANLFTVDLGIQYEQRIAFLVKRNENSSLLKACDKTNLRL